MKRLFKIRLLKLDVGAYRFSPGLVFTLITLFLMYVMYSLGQWQISRAQYKDNLQQKIEQRQKLPAIDYNLIPADEEERVYLPAKFRGQFDGDYIFLHDNRIVDGVVGYDVYTPLKLNNGTAVLVNRGFLPQGRTRQDIPEVSTPADNHIVSGLLEKEPTRGMVLLDNLHDSSQWPLVLQYVDIAELEGKLDYKLFPMILRLAQNEPGAFKYHQPVVNLNSAKNSGYAFQWFAMMLALFIIYIVVNTKKRTQST